MKRALSKADIRRVERAAEEILMAQHQYCCVSLKHPRDSAEINYLLPQVFREFYAKDMFTWWPAGDYRNQRAMALLFFAYAPHDWNDEGVKS